MLVAVEGEGGSLETAGAFQTSQVMWSVPWGVGESAKVSVFHLRSRNEGRVRSANAGMSIDDTFLFTHFLSSLS